MKQRSHKWIALLILLLVAATAFVFALEPGTAEDPLVTKSYVDAKIAALQNSGGTAEPAAGAVFTPVSVAAGKSLIGAGGTELILRSGKATAIDNGKDGVSDLTAGVDLRSGKAIGANHLLLVPRADGRGLRAGTDLWVMVKGPYTIQ
ncbi:MAG TPA: hypothetical protein GX726_03645 [Clostridiales bacterium]|jgi:hypothetical protein|nr:hypothetical protein [Clostridiales bacterium]